MLLKEKVAVVLKVNIKVENKEKENSIALEENVLDNRHPHPSQPFHAAGALKNFLATTN